MYICKLAKRKCSRRKSIKYKLQKSNIENESTEPIGKGIIVSSHMRDSMWLKGYWIDFHIDLKTS